MKEKGHIYALYLGLAILVIVAVSYMALRQPTDKPAAPADKPAAAAPAEDGRKQLRGLALTSKEWTGDFDQMLEYLILKGPLRLGGVQGVVSLVWERLP